MSLLEGGLSVVVSPLPRLGDAKEYSLAMASGSRVSTRKLRISGAIAASDTEDQELVYLVSKAIKEIEAEWRLL